MRRLLAALVAALACAACSADPTGPVTVLALAFDPSDLHYHLSEVQLRSLTSVSSMSGDVTSLVGAATLVVDPQALAAQGVTTADEFKRAVTQSPGGPVTFLYAQSGGVLYPEDFDSLNEATTYYNFEKAFDYFASLGLTHQDLAPYPVYYFPDFRRPNASGALTQAKDNALFYPALKAFLVLPFDQLQALPLSMNLGVVAHEYTHAVTNAKLYQADSLPWPFQHDSSDPEWATVKHLLRSVDEGLADYFGANAVGDPRYLEHSLGHDESGPRDLAAQHCATPAMAAELPGAHDDLYDPYPLGSVLGGALWRTGQVVNDRQAIAEDVFGALVPLGIALQQASTSVDAALVVETLAAGIRASARPVACGLLLDRFAGLGVTRDRVPSCAKSTAPMPTCASAGP